MGGDKAMQVAALFCRRRRSDNIQLGGRMGRFCMWLLFVVALIGLCLGVGFVSYRRGRNASLRTEVKLYHAILSFHGGKLGTTFEQFAKGRYYHLIRLTSPHTLLPESLQDFGAVDEGGLQGIPLGKGPIIPAEDYAIVQELILTNRGSTK